MQETDDTSKNLFDQTTMGDKAMNPEQTGYKEYKCQSCGWVHAAIPRSAVPADADLADYLHCFNCRAPSQFFVPGGAKDAPDGCSLQPVVVPEAWGSFDGEDGAVPIQESAFQHPSYLSLPPPRRGMGEAVLYLDFDGVLHTQDCYFVRKQGPFVNPPHRLFEHMAVLEECLLPYPDIKIVLSTSWVRRLGYIDAASRLSLPLRKRVIGATFHTQMNKREFSQLPRGEQVLADVERRCPRWWLALDDDAYRWPSGCMHHLIWTHGDHGLGLARTVDALKIALSASLVSLSG